MTITVDTGNITIATPQTNAGSPQTFSHTCGADVDLLVVVITIYDTSDTDGVVSAVSYNGDPLASATLHYDSLSDGHVSIWWMAKPDTGSSYTVSVTFGGVVTDFEAAAVGVEGTVGSFAFDAAGTPATGTTGDLVITWNAVANDSISFAAALDDQTDAGKVTPQETEIYTVDVGDVVSTEYAIRSASGSQTMTIADADGDEDWVIVGAGFKEIVGATQYQQSADGVLTAAGDIVKESGKILAGITTLTGAVVKETTKTFTGSSTLAGSLVKQVQKLFTGATTAAGILSTTKVTLLSVGGALTPAGALIKQTVKAFTGSTTSSGTLIKSITKAFTGSVTASGLLIKQVSKILTGATTAAGSLVKRISKIFTGAITAVGDLATQKSGGGGSLTLQAVGGVLTMTGGIVRQINKKVSGIITTVGILVKQNIGIPTPAKRIYAIDSEIRIYSIAAEERIYSVPRGATT